MESENKLNPFIIASKSKKFKIKRRGKKTTSNGKDKLSCKDKLSGKDKLSDEVRKAKIKTKTKGKKKKLKLTKKIKNKQIILLPTTNSEHSTLVNKYLSQLTELEKTILDIAQNHLDSSYNIEKSIGYLKWLEKTTEK